MNPGLLSGFGLGAAAPSLALAAYPVGVPFQSLFNMETQFPGRVIALDGRDLQIGQYPELERYPNGSKRFVAGTFTPTARTLFAAPYIKVVITDGVNFLAPGAAGTDPLQASTAGATWTSGSATWAASTNVASMIVAGSRTIIAGNAGDTTAAYVSTAGAYTAGNVTKKASWTVTTSAVNTDLAQGLAFGATGTSGLGRTLLVKGGAGTTTACMRYLDDTSTNWVTCTGASSATRVGAVHTGQKYVVICSGAAGLYQTSSDGIAFTDNYCALAPFASAGAGRIATDGKGTVIAIPEGVTGYSYGLLVSTDHCATWRLINLPKMIGDINGTNLPYLSYVNGRFVMVSDTVRTPFFFSINGLDWGTSDPALLRIGAISGDAPALAYNAGIYCGFSTASTRAYTLVEDSGKYHLPHCIPAFKSAVGISDPPWPWYIKVRSN